MARGVHTGLPKDDGLRSSVIASPPHDLDRPYSILITDDDPVARETLREIVAPQGYHTLMAESGEEALDLVREHEVHLALFDMHLPGSRDWRPWRWSAR